MSLSGDDPPERLTAFNALIAMAGGRRAEAAGLLQRLITRNDHTNPYPGAALESGLWLALDQDPQAASEPLERLMIGES